MNQPRVAQERALDGRLDVQSRASLERDDSLGVPPRARPSVPAQDEPRDEKVERVHAEPEGDLPPNREPPHARERTAGLASARNATSAARRSGMGPVAQRVFKTRAVV